MRGDYEELGGTLWLEPVNLTRELERAASADRQPSLSARAIVVPARIQSAGFAVATGSLIAFGVLESSTA